MYSNNGANYYDIISATGLKNIHLNGKLTRSNGIDTDGDGLTDWDETDTESGLITWDQSGNIVLPTFAKCMEVEGDKYFYVKSGLDRFINGYANYLHYLYNKRILPIKSDPTSLDSDGDGLLDNDDPEPLVYQKTEIYSRDAAFQYSQKWFNDSNCLYYSYSSFFGLRQFCFAMFTCWKFVYEFRLAFICNWSYTSVLCCIGKSNSRNASNK